MKTTFCIWAAAAALAVAPFTTQAQDGMKAMPGMTHGAATDGEGVGIVKAIDSTQGTITLQHEAIASIHWPAMTMPFHVARPELLKAVKVGDKVRFTVHPAGMDSTITAITSAQP
jgi:Cu(I)/Ag(I) efflux system protein CusF